MADKKEQPAQLKRRIAQLEGYLAAEKQVNLRLWEGYRNALYELTDLKIKVDEVEKALRGER